MKTVGTTWALWVAVVAASWPWPPTTFQAAAKTEVVRAAAEIVAETLQCEAREGVEDRARLLDPAIEQSPDCEAAWWHSGFLYDQKRKEWLRWDDVQQYAATDERLAAYRQIRAKYPETIDGQLGLARWCLKHKLEEQALAHFSRVLEFDPGQAEARQGLGFRLVDGAWVDNREKAETQTAARKASAAAAAWAPRLENLRNRLVGNNAADRDKARGELMAIRDADAAEAIDAVFCRQTGEMALLGIEALKNILAPRAATVLAWHAVCSPWPQVRQAAAAALRLQEKYDYVPMLLQAAQMQMGPMQPVGGSGGSESLAGSVSPRVQMVYRLDSSVRTYSWNTVNHLSEHPQWQQIPNMRFDPKSPNPVASKTTNTVQQGVNTTTTQKREYYTVRDGRLQDRVTQNRVTATTLTPTVVGAYVYPPVIPYSPQQTGVTPYGNEANTPHIALAAATGENRPASTSEWWDWWYDYNEVYQSSGKLPKAPAPPDPKAPADGGAQSQRGDCLAGGTLVRAETGLTAIEKLAVGDRIICCDPETGCLALKPILRKTVRPEGRLLKIRAGGEEFEASGGQVFWVSGRGWVKARELREGMQLHTIRRTVPVEGIEPGALQTTFGLVAADFHTFFAGKEMVLTHDNTIRPPTDRIVPGLAPKAVQPVDP